MNGTDNLEPNTTKEQDLHTAGQRRINLIWESTQAIMGLLVILANIYAALKGIDSRLLGDAFVLIIALYFVRTNHQKIGGVVDRDSR